MRALIGSEKHFSGPEQSMQSMAIDNNRWQSISINRIILIIDGQSITKMFVIIDYHRLSISIDNRWESIN